MFALSIKFMKDEAIKVISLEIGDPHFRAEDIQWVLTVPAIWTPAAKQFMREAAYEVILIKTSLHLYTFQVDYLTEGMAFALHHICPAFNNKTASLTAKPATFILSYKCSLLSELTIS